MRIVRKARTSKTNRTTIARKRVGISPSNCFMRTSDFPYIAQLRVRVSQPIRQRFGQTKGDFCSHHRMQVEDFHKIRMEKTDQLRLITADRSSGSRTVSKQRHLSKKVTLFQLRQDELLL